MCPSASESAKEPWLGGIECQEEQSRRVHVFYLADERLRLASPPYHVNGRVEDDRDRSRGTITIMTGICEPQAVGSRSRAVQNDRPG